MTPTHLYRYYFFYWGETRVAEKQLLLEKYLILKETPCGFWIDDQSLRKGKRFVLKDSRKRFAHVKREDALQSFIARRKKHIMHCEYKLKKAKISLRVAQQMQKKQNTQFLLTEKPKKKKDPAFL